MSPQRDYTCKQKRSSLKTESLGPPVVTETEAKCPQDRKKMKRMWPFRAQVTKVFLTEGILKCVKGWF